MKVVALLLLTSSLGYVASQDNVYIADVNCPLDCSDGSSCATGAPDFTSQFGVWTPYFPFLNEDNNVGYHCNCPPGRTGLLCEHEYEICDEEHFCFHGGKCLPELEDVNGNEKYYCDCKSAIHNGNRYAGRFCESRSVDFCSNQPDDDFFCVNGGTCKTNYQQSIEEPCDCPSGYDGPHCEYETGDVPSCTLQCYNGGACQVGAKEYGDDHDHYNDFWDEHHDYMYCVCPDGFFGLQCEIEGRPCGENHCFNGGTCVTKQLSDGTVREFCDCSTATTDERSYAGRYCEAESTSFCSKMPDQNGHQFCVNGGTCKAESHLGCDCLDGFNGPICEFRDSHVPYSECNLECEHNGVCRNGAKDLSYLKKFGMNLVPEDSYSDEFEHCVCPRGFVGLSCEHPVEVCPGGQHICMHGANCVPTLGDDHGNGGDPLRQLNFGCDCDAIKSNHYKFSGEYCEMQSTDLCTEDNRPGRGRSSNAFCVNNGACVARVGENEGHPGCICPFGFEGEHCEIVSEGRNRQDPLGHEPEQPNGGGSRLGVGAIIAIVVVVDLIAILAFAVYFFGPRYRKNRNYELESQYSLNDSSRNHSSRGGSAFSQMGMPPPPTLENILSMGTSREEDFEEYHDEPSTTNSSARSSRSSRSSSGSSSRSDSTGYSEEEKKEEVGELHNVNII